MKFLSKVLASLSPGFYLCMLCFALVLVVACLFLNAYEVI